MDRSRLRIGKIGESLAVSHLKARGCKILAQNYRAGPRGNRSHRQGWTIYRLCRGENTEKSQIWGATSRRNSAKTEANFQDSLGVSTIKKPLG